MASKIQQIQSALKLYKVAARITGTLLLLLVLEMTVRYGLGLDLWLAGPQGFLALVEHSTREGAMPNTGLNISTAVLIVHGWFYVLYLYSDFRIWTLLRWDFTRFLVIAAGGVVPFLSFFTEHRFAKIAAAELAAAEAGTKATA
jgi:integral membrane protein